MMNPGEKSCGSCKHYEPSAEWRRGWCRSTLLFAPSQSHMVQSEELDCSRGSIDFWEPKSPPVLENAGDHHVKLPNIPNPLNLFTPAFAGPALGTSSPTGGHMMFASSGSGGGGGYDDDDYGYDDDYPVAEVDEAPAERPQSNRTRRGGSGRGNDNGGRSRSASYQPEERYWTDYLRIALPVIGIILMLGLLWIWASQLLGDDNNVGDSTPDDTIGLVATQTPDANAVNAAPTSASTPGANTTAGEIPIPGQGQTPAAEATNPPFNPTQQTPAAGGDTQTTATEPADEAASGDIAVDSQVRITEEVNVRPSAGTTEAPIRTAAAGETGTVISGPEEADGFTWWELVFDDGSSGFVAEDFLEVVP